MSAVQVATTPTAIIGPDWIGRAPCLQRLQSARKCHESSANRTSPFLR